ncbi:hypothetical protein C8R47DRAFT_1229738 [Mycena vitilis]|nr:hypothetical protein C8R47DRAFT_1229738 [Mycena vitilis]
MDGERDTHDDNEEPSIGRIRINVTLPTSTFFKSTTTTRTHLSLAPPLATAHLLLLSLCTTPALSKPPVTKNSSRHPPPNRDHASTVYRAANRAHALLPALIDADPAPPQSPANATLPRGGKGPSPSLLLQPAAAIVFQQRTGPPPTNKANPQYYPTALQAEPWITKSAPTQDVL